MAASDFHDQPFDEGTRTKLRVFELYAQEWFPVFLCKRYAWLESVHVFDFFSGPGKDGAGRFGSPLIMLEQLKEFRSLPSYSGVHVGVHFYDGSARKISQLKTNIDREGLQLDGVSLDIRQLEFEDAFKQSTSILSDSKAAKLVLIDQFGVDHVTAEVFKTLARSPVCDFLFFLSSSTLHRFRDHPHIKQKIERPDDYFHVHRAALEYYRNLLAAPDQYFLAPFSIKKGSNIYGLIFGSAHPLGIDKFLQVAWKNDAISGEADFDIDRDNIKRGEMLLPFDVMRPSKVAAFEGELENLLRSGKIKDESDVVKVCFQFGVKRQHAEPVLIKLKREGIIDLDFRVPDIDRMKSPRLIRFLGTKK
jgi:three-Cys-motif partner protein